jgi:hypothetical protein
MSLESMPQGGPSIEELLILCEETYNTEDWSSLEEGKLYQDFESVKICRQLEVAFESQHQLANKSGWTIFFDRTHLTEDQILDNQHMQLPFGLNTLPLHTPSIFLPSACHNLADSIMSTSGKYEVPYLSIVMTYSKTSQDEYYMGPHLVSLFDTASIPLSLLLKSGLRPGVHPAYIPFMDVVVSPDYIPTTFN